jgi:hypothetical protein
MSDVSRRLCTVTGFYRYDPHPCRALPNLLSSTHAMWVSTDQISGSVPMLSAANLSAGETSDRQYSADDDDGDTNRPDDRDFGDETDDQQDDPDNNQSILLFVVPGVIRQPTPHWHNDRSAQVPFDIAARTPVLPRPSDHRGRRLALGYP